jgi:signal transduction histidine kinase
MLARRLLIALTIVPVMLGWTFILAREHSLVSREVGIAILVVVVMAIQLTVLVRAAAIVQRGERAQAQALENAAAARDEAQQANRAKNDFLAVMSHELRTPLNAIIGYGSLLRDGIPDPATSGQRKQIDRIGASAKHLLALIDEVLTLSRLELGRERITPTAVGVATLVEEAAAMMEPEVHKKGLTLSIVVPEQEVTMVTDAGKLRQALVNLLGNAVKFTDHGEVCIRARYDRDAEQVEFEVEDTGIGIDAQHLPRVFDAFWQVDQAPTRRVGGTGLGLHVTRRLVLLLGGEVAARSTIGRGSCFSIRVSREWWGATEEAHEVDREPAEVVVGRG